ncbi:MAG: hypothetical protein WBA12_00375 [Catalinimonas sp.]
MNDAYRKQLLDPRWQHKRAEIMERDRNACVHCRAEHRLEVHHKQYHFVRTLASFKAPWEYEAHLLVTLCERCHRRGHELFKVPVKYVG